MHRDEIFRHLNVDAAGGCAFLITGHPLLLETLRVSEVGTTDRCLCPVFVAVQPMRKFKEAEYLRRNRTHGTNFP